MLNRLSQFKLLLGVRYSLFGKLLRIVTTWICFKYGFVALPVEKKSARCNYSARCLATEALNTSAELLHLRIVGSENMV